MVCTILKILCARQSACELHNPAPLHWVESWFDAIQWLDLSFRRTILLFLLTKHIGFRMTMAIAVGGHKTLSQHQVLVCTHLER